MTPSIFDVRVTVSSVQLFSAEPVSLAHTKEEDRNIVYMYGEKEEFNTNINGLILKWEELGGDGSSKEEGEG